MNFGLILTGTVRGCLMTSWTKWANYWSRLTSKWIHIIYCTENSKARFLLQNFFNFIFRCSCMMLKHYFIFSVRDIRTTTREFIIGHPAWEKGPVNHRLWYHHVKYYIRCYITVLKNCGRFFSLLTVHTGDPSVPEALINTLNCFTENCLLANLWRAVSTPFFMAFFGTSSVWGSFLKSLSV